MTKTWSRHFDSHPAKRTTAEDLDFLAGDPSADERETDMGGVSKTKKKKKKKKEIHSDSSEILGFLSSIAIGRWNQIRAGREYLDRLLAIREARLLKVEQQVSDLEEAGFGMPTRPSSVIKVTEKHVEPPTLAIETADFFPVPVLYEPSNLMTSICLNSDWHFDSHPASGNAQKMKSIEAILSESSDEKEAIGGIKRRKKGSHDFSEMLGFLKKVIVGQWDEIEEDCRYKDQVLAARKAMFLSMKDVSDLNEFPYPKKQKTHKLLHTSKLYLEKPQMEPCGHLDSRSILNQPTRRSKRKLLKIGDSEMPRKRIPIDPAFQADVPDWTSPPDKEQWLDDNELNDSRWLGTKIWPREGDDTRFNEESIGKGRPGLCFCSSPGSVDCIRFHVKIARRNLKSDLGPAFSSLGFDSMGEEVSRLWPQEDQRKFEYLIRHNPTSEDRNFLEHALEYFTSKSRQDIINFYYNVFLLRWMSSQTRLASGAVDSDDENMGTESDSDDKKMGGT